MSTNNPAWMNQTPPWNKNNANNGGQAVWGQKTNITNSQPNNSNYQSLNTNNNVPWAKNTSNQNSPSNQPPWAKKNTQTSPSNLPLKQSEAKLPPWVKQNNNLSNGSNSQNVNTQPSWAKQNINQNQISQPPWAKQNVQSNEKQPPWMKKQPNSPTHNQSNLYKLQQSAQIQKQKKEFQQKIKKQQEEQRQLKRIEKQKRQKQLEQANIKRQLQIMKNEQQLSIKRQKFDKQQIERIQRQQLQILNRQIQQEERLRRQLQQKQQKERRQQQQRQKRKQQQERQMRRQLKQKQEQQALQRSKELKSNDSKSKSKSKIKSSRKFKKQFQQQQNSKISHISSIKALQLQMATQRSKEIPQNQNLFHKYNRLINEEHNELNYKSKIQIQRQIIDLQLKFKKQSQLQIINIFEKKKITNRKRKFIISNSLQIKYALCEGKKKDNKINFITSQCDQLKNRFLCYEMLNRCIFGLLKKKMNIHLRVPLLNLGQYKGIVFLIQYICQQLTDIIEIDVNLYQEINNEISMLQKELELYYEQYRDIFKLITKNEMLVKKINIYGEDYYFIYLKDNIYKDDHNKKKKTYKQIDNFNQLSFLEYLTSPAFILPYYQKSIILDKQTLEHYQIVGSPLKQITQSIFLGTSINTVYGSCQGEINEQSFFQLILDENKQIWQMISLTGYHQKDFPLPLTLSYLQKICSVKFKITAQLSNVQKGKKRQLIKSIQPKVNIQKHDFQFLQFIKNTQKYINQGKDQLIQLSITMNHEFWSKISDQFSINFIQIKNEINYLIYKKQYQKALQYLQSIKNKLCAFDIKQISIALLQIRIFIIQDQEIKMINKLTQLINLLQFYFKTQTIMHSYIYTIVGTYYSKKSNQSIQNKQKNVIAFYEHAINIALKLYGQKAYEIAQIYLNRANAFFNLSLYELFHKDISHALKIFKIHSKSGSKIAQCYFLIGKVECSQGKINQGVKKMELSIQIFQKLQNYMQTLNIYFCMLQFIRQNQAQYEIKIQKMIEICFIYKCVPAFRRLITIILDRQLNCYSSLTINNIESMLNQDQYQEERTNQQILIDLQNFIKGFTSFIEILRWSLSILAAKIVVRRQASTDFEKAFNIMKNVFHFYIKENRPLSLELKQSYLI